MHARAAKSAPLALMLSPGTRGWLSTGGAIVLIFFFAAAFWLSPNFGPSFDPTKGPYGGDFLQEWIGGHLVLTGQADQLYQLDHVRRIQHDPDLVGYSWNESRYLPMVYPPFYYALVSPLAAVAMKPAAILWAILMVVALVASSAVLYRTRGKDAARAIDWLAMLALLVPIVENLTTNQKGGVLLLLFAATFALLTRGKPFAAGFVFGLVAFKPQLTLVIALAMLYKRQWRFVAGGAVAVAALVALSLAVSERACRDYLEFTRRTADYLHTAGYDLTKSHSWYGFFHLLLEGQSDVIIRAASAAMILVALLLVATLLRGPLDAESATFPIQFSGLVIATILVSPHLLTYDLTLLVLPAVLLTSRALSRGEVNTSRVAGGLLIAAVVVTISTPLARATGLQISVPAMFALLAALARFHGLTRRPLQSSSTQQMKM
jgi:hypothetical protein